jgi:hypothetical protein
MDSSTAYFLAVFVSAFFGLIPECSPETSPETSPGGGVGGSDSSTGATTSSGSSGGEGGSTASSSSASSSSSSSSGGCLFEDCWCEGDTKPDGTLCGENSVCVDANCREYPGVCCLVPGVEGGAPDRTFCGCGPVVGFTPTYLEWEGGFGLACDPTDPSLQFGYCPPGNACTVYLSQAVQGTCLTLQ